MNCGPLLTTAALALVAAIIGGRAGARWRLGLTLVAAAAAIAAGIGTLATGAGWDWRPGFTLAGQPLHLRLDVLGALFLVLLGFTGGVGAVFARGYWENRLHPRTARTGHLWWCVLLLSLGSVLVVSNGVHFLLAWELFAVSAYFLVTLDRQRGDVRTAGWLYLASSHAATLGLFAFFTLLAAKTGGWELGPMKDQPALAPLFWIALFSFGLKAGVFPLHFWLPSAHANAPSHVSAMLSGMTLKIGIYGLVRFSGWLPVPVEAGWVVATLGAASAVLGVAFALGQHDLKRLLAYHSVENIGIILLGLGFALIAQQQGDAPWGRLALAGGLLHVWNHGLFKSLLFFGAGSVLHATGTREMSRLGGLWRAMPWTASLFALGAVAISGLPPLNGFVSEWLVFLGLIDATLAHGPAGIAAHAAAILLGVTGALALACFAKVCGVVFLGSARTDLANAHEAGPSMRVAMIALAAACVAIGLAPVMFWPAIARAADAWNPEWARPGIVTALPALGIFNIALAALAAGAAVWLWRRSRHLGIIRGPTWDCGYANPTPRMQYTAASFAAIITEWFELILRPVKHAVLPAEVLPGAAGMTSHSPETVLEHIVEPAGGLVMRFSAAVRSLQHGRVHAYVLYLVLGLAGLAVVALFGGGG